EPVAVQPNVATLVIRVPADAHVYLDGRRTRTANQAVRTFVTPKLADGSRYVYEVRAEIIRDGRVRSETRRVAFYVGSKVDVSFRAWKNPPTRLAPRPRSPTPLFRGRADLPARLHSLSSAPREVRRTARGRSHFSRRSGLLNLSPPSVKNTRNPLLPRQG